MVFEDASSGAKAGRAAGCTVVATTFSHPIESLDAAHYLIEDMTGVELETLPGDEGLGLSLSQLRLSPEPGFPATRLPRCAVHAVPARGGSSS